MKVLMCTLLFFSLVRCEISEPPNILKDIQHNSGKIAKIFENVSTLNILVKNFLQPEGAVQLLGSSFRFGEKTFVIFNFNDEKLHETWIERCRVFRNDSSIKVLCYERLFRKNHEPRGPRRDSAFLTESEHDANKAFGDPQIPGASSSLRLHESFAEGLDNWFTFRQSGFILFCTIDVFELYVGCLLSRAGIFLFIIEDSHNEQRLENVLSILKKAWKSCENMKLFVLILRELYIFNPFATDENTNSFGILEKLSDSNVVRDVNKLNGYPMTVELFNSVYSVELGTEFIGKLDSFVGPDIEVARFIQVQMNVTSN